MFYHSWKFKVALSSFQLLFLSIYRKLLFGNQIDIHWCKLRVSSTDCIFVALAFLLKYIRKICAFLFNIGWLRVVTTVHWIKMQVIENYKQPYDVLFTLPCKSELSLLSKSYNFYRATENLASFLSSFYLKSQKFGKKGLWDKCC